MSLLFRGSFSTHARRAQAWERAARIPGCDKAVWRCDDQGRVMRWDDLGDRFSEYGWGVAEARGDGWLAHALGVTLARAVHLHELDPFAVAPSRRAA